MKKSDLREWLTIDKTYRDIHTARDYLLTKNNAECIQIKREGEDACEELLQEIVKALIAKYPDSFSIKTVNRRRLVRNEITKEEWSLVRPFDCHPLEVCARLATEDFNILVKGEFTQQYYLSVVLSANAEEGTDILLGKPARHSFLLAGECEASLASHFPTCKIRTSTNGTV